MGSMNTLTIVALVAMALYMEWRTVEICLKYGAWLPWPVLALEGALLFLGPIFPIAFLMWKAWFFFAAARWEPTRGLFRLPDWPRAPRMRGPGKRRWREFREPAPWSRGPSSF